MTFIRKIFLSISFLLAILTFTDARRISESHFSGSWYLDSKTDSAGFFSADTLQFTNSRAMPPFGGCYGYEIVKHHPSISFGNDADLEKNQFFIILEKDTVWENEQNFFGVFTVSNRSKIIDFEFRQNGNSEPIDIEKSPKWFMRKYQIIKFSKEKLVLAKE